jgi:long-chain acyl-CoA synthetase
MSRSAVSPSQSMTNPNRSGLDYGSVKSLPGIWSIVAQKFGNVVALHDPHSKPEVKLTYAELYRNIQKFAAGLQALGIQAKDHIALFSDNSPRWLVADQGIMTAGAVDAVRGAQADRDELLFILANSDSVALVVQDQATLKRISAGLADLPLRFIVLLTDETPTAINGIKMLTFQQVLELGADRAVEPVQTDIDDLATLMYTSGTSGLPKGVMLTHRNLLYQVTNYSTVVQLKAGEPVLSILPIWHCYERSFEYFIFSQGCTQIYTNIRHVKQDLKQFKPHYMVGVPRLWESIYEGVQKQFREQPAKKQKLIQFFLQNSQRYIEARRIVQGLCLQNLKPSAMERLTARVQMAALWPIHRLGDKLVYQQVRTGTGGEIKFVVSGGGSIAEHLEDFFEVAGITILGGYGLTETSPVTHVRRPWRNLRGADGQPLPNTETKIVDLETRATLPPCTQGLILIRGPQVMKGYYKNPEATTKAIDAEGWFNTGDLGMVTPQDDLIITGRAKDTIVLTNGENIEPQPIEDACIRSPYIDQIMLVGQDQRILGALIVPNLEAVQKWAEAQNLNLVKENQPTEIDLSSKPVQDLFRQELNQRVQTRPGYRPDERVGPFRLMSEPFSIENGMMTQTLKIRRNVVMEHYQDMINDMFA